MKRDSVAFGDYGSRSGGEFKSTAWWIYKANSGDVHDLVVILHRIDNA
jgi:hypothetical protein